MSNNPPPYINPAAVPSFLDPNNPLTAPGPYHLQTGTIALPGGPQLAVWTIRTPDVTLTVMLTAEQHAQWVAAVAGVQLSRSGLQVVRDGKVIPGPP